MPVTKVHATRFLPVNRKGEREREFKEEETDQLTEREGEGEKNVDGRASLRDSLWICKEIRDARMTNSLFTSPPPPPPPPPIQRLCILVRLSDNGRALPLPPPYLSLPPA